MLKNTSGQKLYVYSYTASTGLPLTGDAANMTAYVAKDFGSVTILGDTSATEVDSTNAKGWYVFDLTQAETNFNTALFTCKTTTATAVNVANPSVCYSQDYNGEATALLDLAAGVETSVTLRQAMRALAAALCGNVTSSGGAYAALANSGTPRLAVTNPTTTTRSVTSSL